MSNVNFIPILTNKNGIDSISKLEGQYLICLDDDNSSLYIDYTDSNGDLVRKEIIDGSKYTTKEESLENTRTTKQYIDNNKSDILQLRIDVDKMANILNIPL
jgi:hypothetical protein